MQVLLSTLTVFLIYLLGLRIFGSKTALLAAAFAAFYPFMLYYCGIIMSETLFSFLLLSAIYLFLKLPDVSVSNLIAAGLTLGFATLVRPTTVLFPVAIIIWLLVITASKKEAVKKSILVTACMFLVLAPWTVRNYIRLGQFVPLSSKGGHDLWVSNHPVSDGTGVHPQLDPIKDEIKRRFPGELARDRFYRYLTIKNICDYPRHYLKLIGLKFYRFWNVFPQTSFRDKVVSVLSYGVLLPFFLLGMYYALKRNRNALLLYLLVLYFTLFHCLLFYGSTRFRFPLAPYFLLFAAAGIVGLWEKWRLGKVDYLTEAAGEAPG